MSTMIPVHMCVQLGQGSLSDRDAYFLLASRSETRQQRVCFSLQEEGGFRVLLELYKHSDLARRAGPEMPTYIWTSPPPVRRT